MSAVMSTEFDGARSVLDCIAEGAPPGHREGETPCPTAPWKHIAAKL